MTKGAAMLTLDLPQDIQRRLEEASRESGESLSSIARSAFLDWLEDYEDVMEAERRMAAGEGDPGARIPLEEVIRRLALDN